jgi:poly(A) polymerase
VATVETLHGGSGGGGDHESDARAAIAANPLIIMRTAAAIAAGEGPPRREVTVACRAGHTALGEVDPAAVQGELESALVGRDVDVALQWLHEIGVIGLLLPELEATVSLQQEAGRRHKDVWEHTKLVVKQAVPRPAVRWAALLHDVGKVPTRTFTENGVHFHGHAEVGARMFDKIVRRIPFERPMRRKIRFLIKHHLRSAQYSPDWSDSAVRRFAREMEEHLTDLLDLSRADITSRRPGRRQSLLKQISQLKGRIEALREEDARVPPLPTGLGNAIMERFSLPPSRLIGDLMRELTAAVESGALEPQQPFEHYLDWLEQEGKIPAGD